MVCDGEVLLHDLDPRVIRVQRGRRKTTVIGLRRAELTRAVESLRQDARRRKSEDGQKGGKGEQVGTLGEALQKAL